MKSFLVKSFALAISATSLMACELDGNITANQDLVLKDKKGRVHMLQANRTYSGSIEKDGNALEIDIKINGDERKILVRPPAGQSVPKQEGEMFVTAAQAGQAVDFHGILNTDYDRGPDRSGTQSCTTQEQVQVCHDVLRTRPNGSTVLDRVCNYQLQTVSGQQEIEYHSLTTTTTGEIRMLNPGTSIEAAKFFGRASKTEQVITWSSNCRTFGHGGGGYDRDRRDDRRDDRFDDRRDRREERRERRERREDRRDRRRN